MESKRKINIIICLKFIPSYIDSKLLTKRKEKVFRNKRNLLMFNPFDEYAIEEAFKLKETKSPISIILISLGAKLNKKYLKRAMALGADRGIHILNDGPAISDDHITSCCLANVISKLDFQLVFCGKESTYNRSGLTGVRLSEALDVPLITSVVEIKELSPNKEKIIVLRNAGRGNRELVQASLPAVITFDKGTNLRRYPDVYSMISAKKNDIETIDINSLPMGVTAPLIENKGFEETKIIKLADIVAPPAEMSAAERIKFSASGGMTEKQGKLVSGSAEECASKLMDHLIQYII